jgi:hypothetical protein
MTFDEVMARYDGKWVLLRVLAEDASHTPAAVNVISAAPTQRKACAALDRLLSPGEPPRYPYYLALAAPRIRTGEELRRVLREAEADADERGVSGWWAR